MAENRDPIIRLQLDLSPDQPGLLEGLDAWLRLGLISEQQVRELCQVHFVCELVPQPDQVSLAALNPGTDRVEVANPFGASEGSSALGDEPITDFVPADPLLPPRPRRTSPNRQKQRVASSPAPPRSPSLPNRWLSQLMGELSVVWLLGLGVFLVVLSSAVLAATQWARFNAAGQYLVLLAYTLVFWAAGLWCRRSPNLQLTAKTLQMITLLLVPLNFWALDGLGLWQGGGVLVGAIAATLLTLAALQVLRQQQSSPLEQANALGLAYLHSGWGWSWVPLLAVYAGVLGSAAATFYGQRRQGLSPKLRWSTVAITAALGLLVVRVLGSLAPEQLGQLSLALGLYGATWVWLGQRRLVPQPESEVAAQSLLGTDFTLGRADRWSIAAGRGLLWWGWLLGISGWLGQAFGVSLLGLGLRCQAIDKLSKRRDLLIAYGIAVQLAFVGWELLPQVLRQAIMTSLVSWGGTGGGVLLGVSLFPYVMGMVALGDWYWRRGKRKLSRFSDAIALGSNLILTAISLVSAQVLVVNLMASTMTALILSWRRPLARWRIVLTYGLGLLAVVVAIDQHWTGLGLGPWAAVVASLAAAALGLSRALPGLWGTSAWLYGVGLSAMTYALLWGHLLDSGFRSGLSWLGLIIPVVLALIGRHPASVLTTGIALPFTLALPWTRLVGLGTATVLTGANSLFYRRPEVGFLTVGFALGWVYGSLADWSSGFPRHLIDWGWVTVGLMGVLWGFWRWLSRPALNPSRSDAEASEPLTLATLYGVICDRWGHILAIAVLVFATGYTGLYYLGWREPTALGLGILGAFLLVLGWRYWGLPQPLGVYLGGWGLELLVAGALVERYPTPVTLAMPTLGLGAIALVLATVVGHRRPPLAGLEAGGPPLATHLYRLTLVYAGLALLLRGYTATVWTGWVVVVAGLLTLEVGRRRQAPVLRWLALAGLSVGWYELVIAQMLRGAGGEVADALLVLAGVAVLIMLGYRLSAGLIDRTLAIPQVELVWAAHLHWFIGSLLMLGGGIGVGFSQATLGWLGLAIAAALILYALSQGRLGSPDAVQHAWVYAGLGELVGWFALGRSLFPGLGFLDNWWGVVACAVAVPIYWVPWAWWGWPHRAWRGIAVGAPLLIGLVTGGFDHIPTLWVLAGFYGWVAWHSDKIRVSYLSAFCVAWAIWAWLADQSIRDSLAWVLPLGLALLYIAQVDPALKRPPGKEQRHWLRTIALAIMLLTALGAGRWTGLPVGMMALAAIAAGLALRIRAPLYVGTVVFVLNALNQLVLLNAAFPFLKWVVGIVAGIALIWIAADVERRRDQWLQLTQRWGQDTLDNWY